MSTGYWINIRTKFNFEPKNIDRTLCMFHEYGLNFNKYIPGEFTLDKNEISSAEVKKIFLYGLSEDKDVHSVLAKNNDIFFKLSFANVNNKLEIFVSWFSNAWERSYIYSDSEGLDIPRYLKMFLFIIQQVPIECIEIECDKYPFDFSLCEKEISFFVDMPNNNLWLHEAILAINKNAQEGNMLLFEDEQLNHPVSFKFDNNATEKHFYASTNQNKILIKVEHNLIHILPIVYVDKDAKKNESSNLAYYIEKGLILINGFKILGLNASLAEKK